MISSLTGANGNDAYNKKLSQARAESSRTPFAVMTVTQVAASRRDLPVVVITPEADALR